MYKQVTDTKLVLQNKVNLKPFNYVKTNEISHVSK